MTQNKKHEVRIFSRDGEANYKWLIKLLRTGMFLNVVREVRPVYISNTGNNFITGLSQSSFAIVYHTKKRGRLNIANVTDSLYDEELKDLSDGLGRSNVVVLVDDVEDSSDSNMGRILAEQRLDSYACKLILISEREKESAGLTGPDPSFSESPISAQMHDAYNSLYHKMLTLKDIIKKAPNSSPGDSSDRPSPQPNSDMSSDEEDNLIDKNGGGNKPDYYPIPEDNNGNNNKKGPKNWKKDKKLWIIGGVILFLIVLLIIVLSVTLGRT